MCYMECTLCKYHGVVDVVLCIDVAVRGRCGDAWEIWWCVGDVVAMKDVVIRSRCGGVGIVGGVCELWWCIEDVVVHGRCCGA
jgi:hypothetical protein